MKDPDGTISRMASSKVRLKSGIEAAKGQNELSTAKRIIGLGRNKCASRRDLSRDERNRTFFCLWKSW